jgi:transposase
LLATPEGVATSWRVLTAAPGATRPSRHTRPDRLVEGVRRLGGGAGQKGGEKVGPNPTDRGRSGTKRHLFTDAAGLPLAALVTGANVHDCKVFEELLDSVPPVKGRRGRPRKRPAKLHADKGYDFPFCRRALHRRRIKVRIARRGKDSSSRLGRHRWVIERTLAWLSTYRRLTVRYERRADIHEAFLQLACSLVCLGYLRRNATRH